ncbi:hypothetical protein [Yersinia pestis]|uniref:hypothetical protein n=1 Tax=Yersinia pestis TaxID=632 RepID=UPI0009785F3D|nr:hypothetical protein [Yersinia pestis]OMK96818.1 hypothetical protein BFI37_02595 [Yersinia pestis subsp. microtus bv. Caucasica]
MSHYSLGILNIIIPLTYFSAVNLMILRIVISYFLYGIIILNDKSQKFDVIDCFVLFEPPQMHY